MNHQGSSFIRVSVCALLFAVCNLTLGLSLALAQWPQWAHDPQHTGAINVAGQNLNHVLADIVYDPFVEQEKAPENGDGDLLVHYQTPLVDGNDAVGSWLVKISASGTTSSAQFKDIAVGEMGPNDDCEVGFSTPPPWPPSPTAVAPTIKCNTIRPGINVAPAIGPDGTIYTIGRNHAVTRYGYVIAVNPNLTPKWTTSMHGILNDGCNVQIPPNGTPCGCSAGATTGVAPDTNSLPSGRVLDDSTSSPVVAPDGSIIYGSYSRYNYAQGHLLRFSSTGQFLASYIFGWDDTPAIYTHGNTFSIVTKDNHYGGVGSYCNDPNVCPPDRTASNPGYPQAYFVTSLSPSLGVEWMYQNTNTLSCTRNPDNSITCVSDHPNGFEWCVNAPAIDGNGVTYANSEDGNLFAITSNGNLKQKIFQQLAIGAAYTPASIGGDGKLYSQNDGHLYVVGK